MRKIYLDNIRWCTIILVVFFHVFFFFNNIGITAMFEGLLEYHQGDGMTFAGVYQYAVYPWFMTLLFVVAGVAAYHTLQHKTAKQFIAGRRNKLLIPSTLGVLVFGFIPGSIVAGASAGAGSGEFSSAGRSSVRYRSLPLPNSARMSSRVNSGISL